MPWHPRKLQGKLVIMLTRNVRHGDPIEGLEVRWGLVCTILRALTARPDVYAHMRLNDGQTLPWREGGCPNEPMHRWYNLRVGLFDVLDEADCRRWYAPRLVEGEMLGPEEVEALGDGDDVNVSGVDLRTVEDMVAAGLDVRFDRDGEDGLSDDVVGGG